MLDELAHLLLIAETGTFTEAARRAHLSQPAITASIRRLEDAMGAPLLVRGRRGAALTAAGRALVPRARAALAAVEDGRRAVAEIAGLHAGEVRIGAGATACTYYLPRALAAFRRRHPGVRFRVRESFTDEVHDALHAGDVDLGIVTSRDAPRADAECDHWLDDQLILVGAPGCEPGAAGYVTFPTGSATRALLLEVVPDADIIMELSGIAAVKRNVRAGAGMALLSRAAVRAELRTARLIEIPRHFTPMVRPLWLVHRGLERLPPAAAALRELLLQRRRAAKPDERS